MRFYRRLRIKFTQEILQIIITNWRHHWGTVLQVSNSRSHSSWASHHELGYDRSNWWPLRTRLIFMAKARSLMVMLRGTSITSNRCAIFSRVLEWIYEMNARKWWATNSGGRNAEIHLRNDDLKWWHLYSSVYIIKQEGITPWSKAPIQEASL